MSDATQPPAGGLHSRADVSIGARLNLSRGKGDEAAKLLWFVILSHTPWDTLNRPTWASNVTLSHESGLCLRWVELGLNRLRTAGMLTTPVGLRPTAKRKWGRLLVPRLGSPVKVKIPDRGAMANLWLVCREVRQRPAALVTLVVGLHALAHREHVPPSQWAPIPVHMAEVRRFVGARKNAAWTQRVRDLEALGLIRREGRKVWLAPVRSWYRSERALASVGEPEPDPAEPWLPGPEPPGWWEIGAHAMLH